MTSNKNEENAQSENAKPAHSQSSHPSNADSPLETKSADQLTKDKSKQQPQQNKAKPTNDLDQNTTLASAANVPVIVNKSNFSIIWILPMIAVLIGIGMVYHDWQNRGIHIQVEFETAEGLEAKKTVLKNRNVDIGLVKKISFSSGKKTILVDIEVDKSMDSFLVEDSEFWVVKPRFGATGFTGVGTLLSGAYIEVSPGQSNIETVEFVGLETPPVTSLNADGIHLKLISRGNKPLKVGNPVLHKGFEVGAVESKYYDDLEQEAHYDIFIHAPFHNLVTENTSFWNVNGLSITTSTQGVSLTMASLDALVAGGVEFGLIDDAEPGVGVPQNYQFQVYDSQESIDEQRDYKFIEYVILVEDSVGGLHKGAPVDYRGIRLGTVSEPYMEFWEIIDIAGVGKEDRIPVVIKLEPERLMKNGYISIDIFKAMVDDWIKEGLTASIENANLITGNLKVSLQPGGKPINVVGRFGEYPVIPAAQGGFASLSKKLENILGELEKLPLNATLANINELRDSADETVKTSAKVIEKASMTLSTLEHSLKELQSTLKGMQPDSQVYRSVEQLIKKVEVALDEIKPIVKEVTNQPNSLVFGGPVGSDKQPQASKEEGN
ncbi:intermembrane transport protein PqiB [Brumicola pallidula]|uniref:Paraquat-inducible protein B n=1 Tax=Brumicola pallidula DSM 14239 = ACAM 615 TaxID=1121922 RepID=K6ZJ07_9ALTE|nr:MlaD family protein [Glaciecola pallidula]GAC28863.1 paraquat-inducible protein B [Glaciecola pallidula DSM 14239 = ACAM 615]